MKRSVRGVVACAVLMCVGSTASAGVMINFVVNFANGTDAQKALFNRAIQDWKQTLLTPEGREMTLTINMSFASLDIGNGGATSNFMADMNNLPKQVDMSISTNTDMFYDGTPDTANDIPMDKKDAYSVMRHELGHALGFSSNPDGYQLWDDCIVRNDAGGFTNMIHSGPMSLATLGGAADANARSHLDSTAHPGDLMNFSVGLGQRRGISQLDVDILKHCFGYRVPAPGTSVVVAAFGLAAFRRRR